MDADASRPGECHVQRQQQRDPRARAYCAAGSNCKDQRSHRADGDDKQPACRTRRLARARAACASRPATAAGTADSTAAGSGWPSRRVLGAAPDEQQATGRGRRTASRTAAPGRRAARGRRVPSEDDRRRQRQAGQCPGHQRRRRCPRVRARCDAAAARVLGCDQRPAVGELALRAGCRPGASARRLPPSAPAAGPRTGRGRGRSPATSTGRRGQAHRFAAEGVALRARRHLRLQACRRARGRSRRARGWSSCR